MRERLKRYMNDLIKATSLSFNSENDMFTQIKRKRCNNNTMHI